MVLAVRKKKILFILFFILSNIVAHSNTSCNILHPPILIDVLNRFLSTLDFNELYFEEPDLMY